MRNRREDQRPHEPFVGRPLVALLDVGPGLLDQPVVLDAGGARRDAGHAAQAAVEVLDRAGGGRHRAVQQPLHEVDPTARRVGLLLPDGSIGRARRQAEAAVRACVDERLVDHTSTPAGSNAARTRSASGLQSHDTSSSTNASPALTSMGPSSPSKRRRLRAPAWKAITSAHGSPTTPPTSVLAAASCDSTARALPSNSTHSFPG